MLQASVAVGAQSASNSCLTAQNMLSAHSAVISGRQTTASASLTVRRNSFPSPWQSAFSGFRRVVNHVWSWLFGLLTDQYEETELEENRQKEADFTFVCTETCFLALQCGVWQVLVWFGFILRVHRAHIVHLARTMAGIPTQSELCVNTHVCTHMKALQQRYLSIWLFELNEKCHDRIVHFIMT